MDKYQIDVGSWETLNRLLDQALELPPTAIDPWLETLAPEFEALKPQLKRMLSRHALVETGDFLNTLPKFDIPPESAPPRTEQPGDVIGPYRLERELGSGGMGVVWLAVRTDVLIKRPVALKLPHGAWKRAGLVERMAREREILATLAHPNIAHLYDAGVTARRPALPGHRIRRRHAGRRVLPRACAADTRAAGVVRAGSEGSGLCARQAGSTPRSQAREHPGDSRGPGAAAGFRHREVARRWRSARDACHRALGARAHAGLRLARADPRRATEHRLGCLFTGRDSLRAAVRAAAVPAAARFTRRARGGHPAGRSTAAQ